MNAKLADFGLSQELDTSRSHIVQVAGTIGYICPVAYQSGKMRYNSDVYSMGIVMCQIMTGFDKHPAKWVEEIYHTKDLSDNYNDMGEEFVSLNESTRWNENWERIVDEIIWGNDDDDNDLDSNKRKIVIRKVVEKIAECIEISTVNKRPTAETMVTFLRDLKSSSNEFFFFYYYYY